MDPWLNVLVALSGGGLVAGFAEVLRVRREGRAQPANIEQVVSAGAREAVASLREALVESNERADRLEARYTETVAELRDVQRRLVETRTELREVRAHNTELEHALTSARDRIRLMEATIGVLQREHAQDGVA